MEEATLLRAMETAGKQVDDEDYTTKEKRIDVRQPEHIIETF
jgi:hypothetical protein